MSLQCPQCGKGRLKRSVADLTGSCKGESYTVSMDALVCPNCDFKTIPTERASQFALRVSNAYRTAHGLLTSIQLKDLRAKLSMTQAQFTDFLGAGAKSVTRWELGDIQSKATDRYIRLAVAERLREIDKNNAARPGQYGYWGGFEQLEEKMAVQLYRKPAAGTAGMPHGPPLEIHSNVAPRSIG